MPPDELNAAAETPTPVQPTESDLQIVEDYLAKMELDAEQDAESVAKHIRDFFAHLFAAGKIAAPVSAKE